MKKRIVLLLGVAALFLMVAMISPIAAPDPAQNVTGIYDEDKANDVVPGETYIAYNFTFDASGLNNDTKLTWFNITDWNTSSINWNDDNNASFDDMVNISLWNATADSPEYIGNASLSDIQSGFNITVNLSDYKVASGAKANITVNTTLNETGLIDGKQIVFNATLQYFNTTAPTEKYTEWANDTHAETIEVLNTSAGPSNKTAWEGDTNVLCANVTITPGNNTVDQYLKAITFNATAESTLDPAYIERFGLWNDTDADKMFETTDTLINSTAATDVNVSFDLDSVDKAYKS